MCSFHFLKYLKDYDYILHWVQHWNSGRIPFCLYRPMNADAGNMELMGLTPDRWVFDLFYIVLLTQSRSFSVIKVDGFYSTRFCVANTTRIYKENLFLYAVLGLVVFAWSDSVVSAAREHLFNVACKIAENVFGKCVMTIGIRLSTFMICKFRPTLSVNKQIKFSSPGDIVRTAWGQTSECSFSSSSRR